MKIGIVTFHKAYNYGAVLQAYALQEMLIELGADCEVIDYINADRLKDNRLFCFNRHLNFLNNIKKLFKDIYRLHKNKMFDDFIENEINLSQDSYHTFEDMKELEYRHIYDIYIVGSDQVWNVDNNKKDMSYLLAFTDDNNKRCSYAASFGKCDLDDTMKSIYAEELKKFRIVSVREESSIERYSFLQNQPIRVALDPTLLLKPSRYREIESRKSNKKKYAFLYTIMKPEKLRKYAKEFCKQEGLELIDCKRTLKFFLKSSPRDFLAFIDNAEYVFTNSFHGTAFSILFRKRFVTEVNTKEGYNNRSIDLLRKLNISDRDMSDELFDIKKEIDYANVEIKLNDLIDESMLILKDIINERQ